MTYFLTVDIFYRSLFYLQHVWYFHTALHPTGISEALTPFYVRTRISQKKIKSSNFLVSVEESTNQLCGQQRLKL